MGGRITSFFIGLAMGVVATLLVQGAQHRLAEDPDRLEASIDDRLAALESQVGTLN